MHFGKKILQLYHFWHTTSLLICELDLLNTFFGRTVNLGRATLLSVSPFAYFKLGQMHCQVIQLSHKLAFHLNEKSASFQSRFVFHFLELSVLISLSLDAMLGLASFSLPPLLAHNTAELQLSIGRNLAKEHLFPEIGFAILLREKYPHGSPWPMQSFCPSQRVLPELRI